MRPATIDAGRAADWLTALLPPGRYYQRPVEAAETLWDALLLAVGDTAARMSNAMDKALDEAVPWLATDPAEADDADQVWGWLAAWEEAFGLPAACAPTPGTNDERRAAIKARLTSRGAVTPADFVAAAAALGWTITIEDSTLVTRADDRCDSILRGDGWYHAFIVSAAAPTGTILRCDSTCDGVIAKYGVEQLRCLIDSIKPAHTVAHYNFT